MDDLALLAPSPLGIMLHICEDFAKLHGLIFNADLVKNLVNPLFCGTRLEFSQEVSHLGPTLVEILDDFGRF